MRDTEPQKEKGRPASTSRPFKKTHYARASYVSHPSSGKTSKRLPSVSEYCEAIGLRLKHFTEWKKADCPLCHGKSTFLMRPDCGAFKCHSCNGAGNGLIKLHMQLHNVTYHEARDALARMVEVVR